MSEGTAAHSVFVTTAYRWGSSEGDSYVVYVGTDREEALATAKRESWTRGFKYGLQVEEFNGQTDEDGLSLGKPVHFIPADMGPQDRLRPHWSDVAQYWLGHFLISRLLPHGPSSPPLPTLADAVQQARERADDTPDVFDPNP